MSAYHNAKALFAAESRCALSCAPRSHLAGPRICQATRKEVPSWSWRCLPFSSSSHRPLRKARTTIRKSSETLRASSSELDFLERMETGLLGPIPLKELKTDLDPSERPHVEQVINQALRSIRASSDKLTREFYGDTPFTMQLHSRVAILLLATRYKELGEAMLRIAAAQGNVLASIKICSLQLLGRDIQTPQKAKFIIESIARDRMDWRAMVVYAEMLANSGDKEDALEMAQQAVESSEVGPAATKSKSYHHLKLKPWKTLYNIATDAEMEDVAINALKKGAFEFHDSEACLLLVDHPAMDREIPMYSRQWHNLMLQAAMAGDARACAQIGKFYLEEKGLYPTGTLAYKKRQFDDDFYAGFQWLLQSARSEKMTFDGKRSRRYAFIALVMRENGQKESGKYVLELGIKEMEGSGAEAGVLDRETTILRTLLAEWEEDQIIMFSRPITAVTLGAQPRMPPALQQKSWMRRFIPLRHQIMPWSSDAEPSFIKGF